MSEKKLLTEEDRDRIHQEAQEILRRVIARKPKPRRPRQRPAFSEEEREARARRAQRYDHDEMVALHTQEGLTTRQIADKLGCHRDTVKNVLKGRGLWDVSKDGRHGRPLSDFCDRGHDQKEWRRESSEGKGDWHCGKCKLQRNAEYKRRETVKRRDNRLEPHGNGWDVIVEGKLAGVAMMSQQTAEALDKKLRTMSRRRGVKL